MGIVEASEDDRQYVVVDLRDEVRGQNLHAEPNHLPQWLEVEGERGAPSREMPSAHHDKEHVGERLGGDAPVGHSVIGHRYAHDARDEQTGDADDGILPDLHLLDEQGIVGNSHARDDKRQEHIARQRRQVGLMIETGNEGSAQK